MRQFTAKVEHLQWTVVPTPYRFRSRMLAGSLVLGGISLALAAPAKALQKIESVTVSGTGQNPAASTSFPLFNPFDPVNGKPLVLDAVSVSLSGSTGGNVVYSHTGTVTGTITAIAYLPTLDNWFGGTDIPGQTASAPVSINASLPVSGTTNNQNVPINLTATSVGPFTFDLTDYRSYFIGPGTGTTTLTNETIATSTGSGFSPNANSYTGFSFTGTNNLVFTYTYHVYDAPGSLPVVGGAAAFGWSRRLRRRLRDARQPQA